MAYKYTPLLIIVLLIFVACKKVPVPKPYGYFRIFIPDTAYNNIHKSPHYKTFPFSFQLSSNATIIEKKNNINQYWFNIHYNLLNCDIHCSYNKISNNLKELTDDAVNFVYKHTSQATAIPEKEFSNPHNNVYGVLFTLLGNTATPYQFFLTDSTHHFFRGAAYCNCSPNQDSLLPIHQYLEKDIVKLIESFQWE